MNAELKKSLKLRKLNLKPVYATESGIAYCSDSLVILRSLPDSSINLVITSPPFALRRKKSYGNVSAEKYCEWIWPFAKEIRRVLKRDGSFILDIGGSWNKGEPTRTLYHFDLLLKLCNPIGGLFKLAQEFYWYNPAKMPAPAQWVTIKRIRVKDAVNPIWWLGKSKCPKASNKRVLRPYSKSMEELLTRGYNKGARPSGHIVSDKWAKRQAGSIASNLIIASNTQSKDKYLKGCRKYGLEVHPARFTRAIPEFFIKFLTKTGDIVFDPFSGSNVVGEVAESLNRKWISSEVNLEYIVGSAFRFDGIGEVTYEAHKSRIRMRLPNLDINKMYDLKK
jgi:site-specific DNA-methyltransferase (cytosine-N4-specific)